MYRIAMLLALALLPLLAFGQNPDQTRATDVDAMMTALQKKFDDAVQEKATNLPKGSANGFVRMPSNTIPPDNDEALFAGFARMYNRLPSGEFVQGGMAAPAINALLQCIAPQVSDDRMEGNGQQLASCVADFDQKSFDKTGKTLAGKPKFEACKICAQKLPISVIKAGLAWCASQGRDPVSLAMQALYDPANYVPPRSRSESEIADAATVDDGEGSSVINRVPVFIAPTYSRIGLEMLDKGGGEGGGDPMLTFTQSSDKLEYHKDNYHDRSEVSVTLGLFTLTITKDSRRMTEKTATEGFDVSYKVGKVAYFSITSPAWYPTNLIQQAYVGKGSTIWKAGCQKDAFFGPNGSLNYAVTGMIAFKDVETDFTTRSGFSMEDQTIVKTDVHFKVWPFISGGTSHTDTTRVAFDESGKMHYTSKSPPGTWIVYGYTLGPLHAGAITPPKTKAIRNAMQIASTDELFYTFQLLKSMVGPVLAPSLNKPSCGFNLLTCLAEYQDHPELFRSVASGGDPNELIQRFGLDHLCECAACLPDDKEWKAKRYLGCPNLKAPYLPRDAHTDYYSTRLTLEECEHREFIRTIGFTDDGEEDGQRQSTNALYCERLIEEAHGHARRR